MTKHLKILGKGDATLLGDVNVVRSFIMLAIENLDMRPLDIPTIHEVELDIKKLGQEPFSDEGGCSGQIIGYNTLSTSHLAIHTWPLREFCYIDVFSCRHFEKERIEHIVKDCFKLYKIKFSDLTEFCEW